MQNCSERKLDGCWEEGIEEGRRNYKEDLENFGRWWMDMFTNLIVMMTSQEYTLNVYSLLIVW